MSKDATPLVSVIVPAFQHAPYIEECLNGILAQQCDFPIEILIGEDGSTDGTREYCVQIAREQPDKIKLFLRDPRQKTLVLGKPSNRKNVMGLFESCRGKYIAICEGDDYWIDTLKLQKQARLLEDHPEIAISFHRVRMKRGDQLVEDTITEPRFDRITHRPVTVMDLLKHGNFIHTPSVMFRNKPGRWPPELLHTPIGDYLLHIVNSQHGHIHRSDDIMTVYRVGSGTFSSLDDKAMILRMVVAQGHILSFLQDPEQRKLAMEQFEKKVLSLVKITEASILDEARLAGMIGWRKLFRIAKVKLANKWKRGFGK